MNTSPAFDDLHDLETLVARRSFFTALARRLVADAQLAEDAVQDAYVEAARSSGDAHGALSGWFTGVVRNVAASLRRRDARRTARDVHAAVREREPSTAELAELLERQRLVARAVLDLDEPYRGTVLLRYFEALKPAAIARREGVAVATVNSRLTRAHAMLRARLDREFGGERDRWVAALMPMTMGAKVTTAGLTLFGATIVKKQLLAAALLVVIGGGAWIWSAEQDDAKDSIARVANAPVVDPSASEPPESAPSLVAEPSVQREAAALGAGAFPVPEPMRPLVVVVKDAETGVPVAGAKVSVTPNDPLTADATWRRRLRDAGPASLLDSEALIRLFDSPGETDRDGRIDVLRPARRSCRLHARQGDQRFGLQYLAETDASSEVELRIGAVPSVVVRVVDDAGRPVGGVPVGLRNAEGEFRASFARRPSDATTGEVLIRDLRQVHAEDETQLEIVLDVPGAVAASSVFTALKWPAGPLTLVCPRTGSVRVTVLGTDGMPWTGDSMVTVQSSADRASGRFERQAGGGWLDAGVVVVGPVAVGVPLVVSANLRHDQVFESVDIAGPRAADEIVEVMVPLRGRMIEIFGRMVDGTGAAQPGVTFWFTLDRERPFGRNQRAIETDSDGRFSLEFADTPDHPLTGPARISPYLPYGPEAEARVEIAMRDGSAVVDLGDVTFCPAAPLLKGVIVDPAGAPVVGVRVRVHTEDSFGGKVLFAAADTDASGAFSIVGEAPDFGEMTAHADPLGMLLLDPQPVPPGTTDLRLVMRFAGAIEGRLLLDAGVPAKRIHVTVATTKASSNSVGTVAWQPASMDESGTFRREGLDPGMYSLAVSIGGSMKAIARVDDIAVGMNAASRDPRLDPLDLRGKFTLLDLAVVDEDGRPLPKAQVFAMREGGGSDQLGRATRALALPVEPPVTAIVVQCDGYFAVSIAPPANGVRTEVVLRKGLPCRLSWPASIPAVAAPCVVRVVLESTEPGEVVGGSKVARRLADASPCGGDFQSNGICELRVPGSGRYRVTASVDKWLFDGSVHHRVVFASDATILVPPEGISEPQPLSFDAAEFEKVHREVEAWVPKTKPR